VLQSDHIWYCELCKDGGDLLLCDTCPKSFHKECLKLEIVPDGEWSCPICVGFYIIHDIQHLLLVRFLIRATAHIYLCLSVCVVAAYTAKYTTY